MSASTTTSTQPICAFFGATGGTANHTLALALKANHQCTALARNPQKLTEMLLAALVPEDTLSTHLHIVKGDIRDAAAVKAVLGHAQHNLIISGLGRTTMFSNVDETICQDGTAAMFKALRELQSEGKLATVPHFIALSTTGISERGRDIPLMFVPLYKVLLKSPHEDKKAMEQLVTAAAAEEKPVIRAYTLVRPALFIEDKWPFGLERVRVGVEEAPKIGYTIKRAEVGGWIYENMIAGDAAKWANLKPNLVAASNSELKKDFKEGRLKLTPEMVQTWMGVKSS